MHKFDFKGYGDLLKNWIVFSQKHLYYCPDRPELICYGAGEHGHWGVHTHQKAFSAFAVAAVSDDIDWSDCELSRETVLSQALGMLRYNLSTHLTGNYVCTDGDKWGHNWIYVLGIERMFHGIEAIEDYLTDEDKENLRALIISECDFLLNEFEVVAGLTENNKPESNIWNGAIFYRALALYPDIPNKEAYIHKARQFFANGISIESDENSDEIVSGCRIGDLFVGANMFDSYACNHHHYLNIGYMSICLSNIAMLHFFLKSKNVSVDEIVYHHVYEQWKLIRTCTFDDGRLLRIGGDSRARYCYCQDYATTVWALVEDLFGEDCSELEAGWLKTLQTETGVNGDGSFLSNRFGSFEERSPVYYTRLESDRANVISMMLYWHKKYDLSCSKKSEKLESWSDEYHGAVFSSNGNRYASFAWRSCEKPQGLLLPKDDSSLAEWRKNLSGRIEGVGRENDDDVEACKVQSFDGGFITSGTTITYSDNFMAEGQLRENMARKYVAFAALPDDNTVLCLQYAKALNRTFIAGVKGIFWNVPNDIFNKRQRTVICEDKKLCLRGGDYADKYETISLGNYVNIDNKIGLASKAPLTLVRSGKRQVEIRGREDSATLYAEEICDTYSITRQWCDRHDVLIDSAFAMTLGDAEETKKLQENLVSYDLDGIKAVGSKGKDGKMYVLVANFTEEEKGFNPDMLSLGKGFDVAKNATAAECVLKSKEAMLLSF